MGWMWHKVNFFKRGLTGSNLEFSFFKTGCLTKAKEPSLLNYLPIAGGRIIGFIPFPRVLTLCEMQATSFRIWTRVTESLSYNGNHYTMGPSIIFHESIKVKWTYWLLDILILFIDNHFLYKPWIQ